MICNTILFFLSQGAVASYAYSGSEATLADPSRHQVQVQPKAYTSDGHYSVGSQYTVPKFGRRLDLLIQDIRGDITRAVDEIHWKSSQHIRQEKIDVAMLVLFDDRIDWIDSLLASSECKQYQNLVINNSQVVINSDQKAAEFHSRFRYFDKYNSAYQNDTKISSHSPRQPARPWTIPNNIHHNTTRNQTESSYTRMGNATVKEQHFMNNTFTSQTGFLSNTTYPTESAHHQINFNNATDNQTSFTDKSHYPFDFNSTDTNHTDSFSSKNDFNDTKDNYYVNHSKEKKSFILSNDTRPMGSLEDPGLFDDSVEDESDIPFDTKI